MRSNLMYFFVLNALVITNSFAGNWSSGGGEILEHAQNPWFLDIPTSSTPVKYCVSSSSEFPVAIDELERLVAKAIRWWDGQFSNAYYPDNNVKINGQNVNLKIVVNTSRFVKEACSESTDLAFQFGNLSEEQDKEFQRLSIDLTRYVALTIRTDYDDNLRGKGFIYVSPDRGSRAFRGQNVRPQAWTANDSQFYRLQSVITHELGHVFGLSHAGSSDSIMSARLAELMVSVPSIGGNEYLLAGTSSSVFFPKAGQIADPCKLSDKVRQFRAYFEIPDYLECFRVRLSLNSLIIEAKENSDASLWHKVGIARFADGGNRRHQQLVTLWLPQMQRVFPGLPYYVSSLLGAAGSDVQQSAVFEIENSSAKKPIFIQATARYVQIGGVIGNKIVPDLLPELEYGRALSGWDQDSSL